VFPNSGGFYPSVSAKAATLPRASSGEYVAKFPAYDKTDQAVVESGAAPRALQPTSHIPIILTGGEAGQLKVQSSIASLAIQLKPSLILLIASKNGETNRAMIESTS
jgi:hypothetical protein